MKLNFSLHFRCFMAGVIILFAGMMLALGIPSYENSVLAEGIEDAFSDFEEDFFFNLAYALFFIFLAYAIGVFLDSFYKPFKKSKSVSKHLEQLMEHFPYNDILLTRFCCSVKGKKSLEDMNVYKYMAS
ncbi:MAG TPA: hypothetical protein H9922_10860, partial [Candidatus Phocaeicola caecigallinarum]|nr:hypothetical protein [Candidatus Phocaeicola caecigallinarum]